MSSEQRTGKRILVAIVLALVLWGVLLAVGAYLGLWHQAPDRGGLRDPRRFWIVLGVVAVFLALWGAALAARARRLRSPDGRRRAPDGRLPSPGGRLLSPNPGESSPPPGER